METLSTQDGLRRDASDLHRALSGLMRVFQFRDRKSVGYHDISVTQCNALASLVRRGTINLGELSTELFLDKSTSSRVVDSLVRKGYATRTVDPADARVRRLAVTMKGRELHARIERELVRAQMEMLAEFDPESRREATGLIDRLARAAAQRFTRPEGAPSSTPVPWSTKPQVDTALDGSQADEAFGVLAASGSDAPV